MYLRHGTFSYLPELSDAEIATQVRYALDHEWPVSIEHTDDPHPRNIYWDIWGLPLFDLVEPDGVMREIRECCATFPRHYVRVLAYDARLGRQTTAMSFVVQRPAQEPGFRLDRTEGADRRQSYALRSYDVEAPTGARYERDRPDPA
jgi:ribulose-bisphosphate carboxylase small chain